METNSENIKSRLLQPLKTGTVGDNLSANFAYTRDMIIENWKSILIAGLIMVVFDLALNIVFQKYHLFDSQLANQTQVAKNIYGDFVGSILAKSGARGIRYYFIIPFVFGVAMFRIYRFARTSEAFDELPKRSFVPWMIAKLVNIVVAWLFITIIFGIVMTVVIIIIAIAFAIKMLPFTILGVVLSIAGFGLCVGLILVMIGVSCQISMFSFFKKVYPIRAIKYSLYAVFKGSGSRRGGLFGLNLWHLVGLSLLVYIIIIVFSSFFSVGIMIANAFIPQTIPFAQYIANGIFVLIDVFLNIITWFFVGVYPMIYVSENLAFSSHPIKQEILDRAAK